MLLKDELTEQVTISLPAEIAASGNALQKKRTEETTSLSEEPKFYIRSLRKINVVNTTAAKKHREIKYFG